MVFACIYERLQELLRSPRYTTAVEEALPRVVAHARSVLEGVKARGRKAGDIMDAATEETLKPQVLVLLPFVVFPVARRLRSNDMPTLLASEKLLYRFLEVAFSGHDSFIV